MPRAEQSKSENNVATATEVKNLSEELDREREMRLRALADFDNYRKRVERERASASRAGKRALILSLLGVMDDFDRALEHAEDSSGAVAAGLHAIYHRLAGVMEAQGVTPIESVGHSFDPALHEALGAVETDEVESGAVLDEVSRGYLWDGELLRPARVRVAK
ncbi:MAG: nucleotide exchange factor GrpE [Blastocatellales bacterium]